MIKITKVFLFSFFLLSFTVFAEDCKKIQIREDFKKIQNFQEKKIKEITSILEGNKSDNFNLNDLFDHKIDLKNPDQEIAILQAKLKENNIIPSEYKAVYSCLDKLKLKNEKEIFIRFSTSLINKKIHLLKENKKLNNILMQDMDSASIMPSIAEELQEDKLKNKNLKIALQKEVIKTEDALLNANSLNEKKIISFKALLEKTKIELIDYNLKYVSSLEGHLKLFDEYSLKISKLATNYNDRDLDEIEKSFVDVNSIWEIVIKDTYNQILSESFFYDLPEVPNLEDSNLNTKSPLYDEVKATYYELIKVKSNVLDEITQKKVKELVVQNTLLGQVNNLRSELFAKLPGHYVYTNLLNQKIWSTIALEVKASPLKTVSFLFKKYLYVKEQLSKKTNGLKQLILDLMLFLFYIGCIFLINNLIVKSKGKIDTYLNQFTFKFRHYSWIKYSNLVWRKIKDNYVSFAWIGILYFISYEKGFSDFEFIIDIIIALLFYKTLKSLVIVALGSIAMVDAHRYSAFKEKAIKSSDSIGKLYLLYVVPILILEGVLGKVYVFTIIHHFALFITFYLLFRLSKDWEEEIQTYIEKHVSGMVVEKVKLFIEYLPSIFKSSVLLIVLVLFVIFNLFIVLTEDFDISKKISANLFKKQLENIESTETGDTTLPEEYLEKFSLKSLDDAELFVPHEDKFVDNVLVEITEWVEEKSDEHTLVLYGDKGIGKTTLLKHLAQEIEGNPKLAADTLYAKVPSKLISKEKFLDFFAELLGVDNSANKSDILALDNKLEKPIIIFLDEAQNIFLSQSGGFDAYYSLINLVNSNTKNIFWVLSFNKYSWLYLDRAFGRNQFFRNVFRVSGWSDQKIKELILKRHSTSNLKLNYDMLIAVTKSEDEVDRYASIESKFFKLLWELSSGNPRTALYLWTTALKRRNDTTLMVHVPVLRDMTVLANASDDILFVLADVLKHENLSQKEIENTTNLPAGVSRNAIKVALERELLFKDDRNRYMVNLTTQYSIIKLLRSKNFIYGH